MGLLEHIFIKVNVIANTKLEVFSATAALTVATITHSPRRACKPCPCPHGWKFVESSVPLNQIPIVCVHPTGKRGNITLRRINSIMQSRSKKYTTSCFKRKYVIMSFQETPHSTSHHHTCACMKVTRQREEAIKMTTFTEYADGAHGRRLGCETNDFV